MSVLTDIRNRGVKDVFFLVCDGLKGLPQVVGNGSSPGFLGSVTQMPSTCSNPPSAH